MLPVDRQATLLHCSSVCTSVSVTLSCIGQLKQMTHVSTYSEIMHSVFQVWFLHVTYTTLQPFSFVQCVGIIFTDQEINCCEYSEQRNFHHLITIQLFYPVYTPTWLRTQHIRSSPIFASNIHTFPYPSTSFWRWLKLCTILPVKSFLHFTHIHIRYDLLVAVCRLLNLIQFCTQISINVV